MFKYAKSQNKPLNIATEPISKLNVQMFNCSSVSSNRSTDVMFKYVKKTSKLLNIATEQNQSLLSNVQMFNCSAITTNKPADVLNQWPLHQKQSPQSQNQNVQMFRCSIMCENNPTITITSETIPKKPNVQILKYTEDPSNPAKHYNRINLQS